MLPLKPLFWTTWNAWHSNICWIYITSLQLIEKQNSSLLFLCGWWLNFLPQFLHRNSELLIFFPYQKALNTESVWIYSKLPPPLIASYRGRQLYISSAQPWFILDSAEDTSSTELKCSLTLTSRSFLYQLKSKEAVNLCLIKGYNQQETTPEDRLITLLHNFFSKIL